MNAPENPADAAWERILPEIRATRRNRRTRKIASATALCAIFGIWLGIRFSPPSENPVDPPVAHVTLLTPEPATLAVLRISHDGTARMEQVSSHEFGETELTFSLSPVITFARHE